MIDLSNDSPGQIDAANKEHAANFLALYALMVQKGLITQKEYLEARTKAKKKVDEVWEEKVKAAEKKMEEKHPGTTKAMRDLFQMCGG